MNVSEKGVYSQVILLLLSIAVCLLPGVLGSLATAPAIPGWYAGLVKPPLTPPPWLFAPVWTLLYLLMGFSLYLLVSAMNERPGVRPVLLLFAVQLVLNGAWSFIFFGFHAIFWGLACLIALDIAVLCTLILSFRIVRPAGYLLVPYMAWLCIATYLNLSLYLLNTG